MRKKYTLSRIGAVALLASYAFGGANAQVRATQQSAPSISNTIMRVASEDGRKLWGNVLFDNRWASIQGRRITLWYQFGKERTVPSCSLSFCLHAALSFILFYPC